MNARTWLTDLAWGAAVLVVAGCTAAPASMTDDPPAAAQAAGAAPDFQKGIVFASWWQGEYATPEADRSLANLADTGANWVAIVVTGYQSTFASTAIRRDLSLTPTDGDLAHAIEQAHELGLQVMLKPHLDLSDDPGHWRGDIGTAFADEAAWRAWFAAYRKFIEHYAALARDHGVEQFCVGTELAGTSQREDDWRAVIRGVSRIFAGPITYASNHSGEEMAIGWWDAVDYIGVDAYYPLTQAREPSAGELRAAWLESGYIDTLARLAQQHAKPILLTEIGYRSVDGAVAAPWASQDGSPVDLEEQAEAYRAALQVLWDQPWLAGMYWWNWDPDPALGGDLDSGYTPYGKPAEAVLRSLYRRQRASRPRTRGRGRVPVGRRERR